MHINIYSMLCMCTVAQDYIIWYVVRRTGTFFEAHPKRQLALEKAINET